MCGIFPKQNAAAHALRQGEQFLKKSFFKQNGASGKGRRVVTDPESQTEDLPFCFFLSFQPSPVVPPGDACHGLHCLAAQKRLVSRQEHAAKKLRHLFQQRGKSQPHCIVSAGQIVQQHRNIAGAAKLRNFVRACHHDAGRKPWSIGRRKCAAKHRFPAEICQQFVGTKTAAYPGRHDDTAHRKKFFHIVPLLLKRIDNSIISKSVLK